MPALLDAIRQEPTAELPSQALAACDAVAAHELLGVGVQKNEQEAQRIQALAAAVRAARCAAQRPSGLEPQDLSERAMDMNPEEFFCRQLWSHFDRRAAPPILPKASGVDVLGAPVLVVLQKNGDLVIDGTQVPKGQFAERARQKCGGVGSAVLSASSTLAKNAVNAVFVDLTAAGCSKISLRIDDAN